MYRKATRKVGCKASWKEIADAMNDISSGFAQSNDTEEEFPELLWTEQKLGVGFAVAMVAWKTSHAPNYNRKSKERVKWAMEYEKRLDAFENE